MVPGYGTWLRFKAPGPLSLVPGPWSLVPGPWSQAPSLRPSPPGPDLKSESLLCFFQIGLAEPDPPPIYSRGSFPGSHVLERLAGRINWKRNEGPIL
jgi:hypothetical protein